MNSLTRDNASAMDAQDDLAPLKRLFAVPPDVIYLNGNSLGLCCSLAERAVADVVQTWQKLAIDGWFEGDLPWLSMMDRVASLVAPLVGADPEEITIANSTTVNLHQLLATLFQPTSSRSKILADATAFPSDLYALRSHLKLRGLDPDRNLVLTPAAETSLLDEDQIIEQMTPEVQLAVLPSVVYHTGQLLDMQRLVAAARERSVIIGFDCSHSVGCIPHRLSEWGADFAFWCGYKYLNGGPGAVAGMYLHRRHFGCQPGLAGWFGSRKERLLEMPPQMESAPDAEALQISTPFVLSLAPLLGSLSVIAQAGIDAIRAKSLMMTELLVQLIDQRFDQRGFSLVTPRESDRRGGQLALTHPDAQRICDQWHDKRVVTDFRKPDLIRIAPSPLYTSYLDCVEAIDRLESIM